MKKRIYKRSIHPVTKTGAYQHRILVSAKIGRLLTFTTQSLQLQPQIGTIRESDVTFTSLNTATVNDGAFDYIQAQFRITNNSATAFDNLTLYAISRSNNINGTALKNISLFGGQDNTSERERISKLVTPIHGVNVGVNSLTLVSGREDFQAFETNEVSDLQLALNAGGGGFSSTDKALGYGFVARRCIPNCTSPTGYSRSIPANGTTGFDQGLINIALRIPRSSGTAYSFFMNFVVVNEAVSRVTRSVYPPETLATAENRFNDFGISTMQPGEIMQIGLDRAGSQSATRTNKGADDINTSSDATNGNASYEALGLTRFDAGANHTCALSASGKAYCWGLNTNGQLGDNTTVEKLVPTAVNGTLTFSSISAAGGSHTCGIASGTAYCWGSNGFGQLGDNTLVDKLVPTAVNGTLTFSSSSAGGSHTCGIASGTAYCWGSNNSGQRGKPGELIPTRDSATSFKL